jgi:hypothetical protein
MVATPVLPLDHVPPPGVEFSVTVIPWQKFREPVLDVIVIGEVFTLIVTIVRQPVSVV